MIFASICLNSSGLIVLTVALVPTGINIGVSNEPCGVCTIPKRAPDCLQVLMCSYVTAGIFKILTFFL